MAVLIVLIGSWLVLRGIGAVGFQGLDSWRDSACYALAVMFIFTAMAHFNKMKHDLARMIPSWFRRPTAIVYVTGLLELAGAVGLAIPAFRKAAGICLIVLLIAMLVANVHAAKTGVTLRGKAATPLWLRLPMQIFFLVLLWWSTRI